MNKSLFVSYRIFFAPLCPSIPRATRRIQQVRDCLMFLPRLLSSARIGLIGLLITQLSPNRSFLTLQNLTNDLSDPPLFSFLFIQHVCPKESPHTTSL